MSKFRSPYSDDRHVPWLGHNRVVKAGEVVQIPNEMDENFAEAGWERVVPLTTTKKIKEGE